MIAKETYTHQPSAGSVSWNSFSDFRGVMKQLVINPSSTSTIYDFSMTNDLGDVIYDKNGLQGTFVDDSEVGLYGIYTMDITNASVSNASFQISLMWREIV